MLIASGCLNQRYRQIWFWWYSLQANSKISTLIMTVAAEKYYATCNELHNIIPNIHRCHWILIPFSYHSISLKVMLFNYHSNIQKNYHSWLPSTDRKYLLDKCMKNHQEVYLLLCARLFHIFTFLYSDAYL